MNKEQPTDADALLERAQAIARRIKEIESIDAGRAYADAHKKLRRLRRVELYNRLARYAACLVIPLLAATLYFGHAYFFAPSKKTYAEVKAATGAIVRYELPDRSVVWLNSGSILRYPTVFEPDARTVEIDGEAYFEVTANPERPFYVHTPDGVRMYVYGTKFNVTAYAHDNFVETVLESGKVNVSVPRQKETVLHPGEQLYYDKLTRTIHKSLVDITEKTAWKEGKLIFRNATLEEIFKQLSRHFNVDIRFHNKRGKEYRYRATFRDETLPQILEYLSQSCALRWKMEEPEYRPDGTASRKRVNIYLN